LRLMALADAAAAPGRAGSGAFVPVAPGPSLKGSLNAMDTP
jgi:hypothetical protein